MNQEVLIPGSVLASPEPGKQHGTITGIKTRRSDGARMASVWLTDRRLRVCLPLEQALSHLLPAAAAKEAEQAPARGLPLAEPAAAAPLSLPVSPLSAPAAAAPPPPPPPPETPMRTTVAVQEPQLQEQQQPEEVEEGAAAPPPPPPPPPPSSPSPPPLSPPTPAPPASLMAPILPLSPVSPPVSPIPAISPAAAASARSGPGLLARLAAASAPPRFPAPSSSAASSPGSWAALAPTGTRVWVLLRGKLGLKDVAVGGGEGQSKIKTPVAWPAVLFSMARVPKADVPLLLQTFNPRANGGGSVRALVLFYGERSLMWSRLADLEPWLGFGPGLGGGGNRDEGGESSEFVASRLSALRLSSSGPKVARKIALAAADAVAEAGCTLSDPEMELERAARARAAGALAAATGGVAAAVAAVPATAVPAAAAAAAGEGEGQEQGGTDAAAAPPPTAEIHDPNVYCCHQSCGETLSLAEERGGSCVRCDRCGKQAHTLCLSPPALKRSDLTEKFYDCPGCGAPFSPGLHSSPASAAVGGGGGASPAVAANDARGGGGGRWGRKLRCGGRAPPTQQQEERMGLTPDRVIEGAVRVFGLQPPTPEVPFIRGLCDPSTNSMACPNIPAERLYDKHANGLLLSNSWAGFHVLLNPEFSANIAHRFVARAIDEVENGSCKSVLLVCRNSTDTRYFQRLRPYPRVHLLRSSIMFKDYDKTPIGFGIILVLMVRTDSQGAWPMISRFFDEFEGLGEPNMPIDREMLDTSEFRALLGRLRDRSDATSRNHWVQCCECSKWRRVRSHAAAVAAKSVDWTCSFLNDGGEGGGGGGGGEEEAANDDDSTAAVPPALPPRLLLPPLLITCDTPQSREETAGIHYAPRAAVEAGILASGGQAGTQVGDGPVQRQEAPSLPLSPAAVAGPPPLAIPSVPSSSKRPAAAAAAAAAAAEQQNQQDGEEGSSLTALELARRARMAANRAYFEGLALGLFSGAGEEAAAEAEAAATGGSRKKRQKRAAGEEASPPPPPSQPRCFLPHDHPSILAAARDLARKAAAETVAAQLASAKERHRAGIEKRKAKVASLKLQLAAALEAEAGGDERGAAEVAAAEEAARAVAGAVS